MSRSPDHRDVGHADGLVVVRERGLIVDTLPRDAVGGADHHRALPVDRLSDRHQSAVERDDRAQDRTLEHVARRPPRPGRAVGRGPGGRSRRSRACAGHAHGHEAGTARRHAGDAAVFRLVDGRRLPRDAVGRPPEARVGDARRQAGAAADHDAEWGGGHRRHARLAVVRGVRQQRRLPCAPHRPRSTSPSGGLGARPR